MTLEDRLRRSLRRVEPSADFAERVLARVDAPPTARRWAIAASVLLAVALAAFAGRAAWLTHVERVHTAELQARQEAARQQLAFALDLTSRELETLHRHLNRMTEETGS